MAPWRREQRVPANSSRERKLRVCVPLGVSWMATGLTIEAARDRLQAVLASIASVEAELAKCASGPGASSDDGRTARVAELKARLNEYIGALRSLHAGVTGGGIVKDGADGEDKLPVEVPIEVVDYLDQGKNPDEAMRLIFGTVLKRAQDVKGKEQALRAFTTAASGAKGL